MKIIDVIQGTPKWHAHRANTHGASEAPVMMGESKHQKRTQLINVLSTGVEREISDWLQRNVLDRGHLAESAARPKIEAIIGEELYPVTAVHDDDERISCSFDGVNMLETLSWEHKLWSDGLARQIETRDLEPQYYWQLEQQLLVCGHERVIFSCGDDTADKLVWMEYHPVEGRAEKIIAGWKQFDEDVANYVPEAPAEVITAAPVDSLPSVSVKMNGSIAIVSNLDLFGEHLRAYVQRIDKNPQDDQSFADCEKAVKVLKSAEDALTNAEESALAQTVSIEEMRRTVGDLRELARSTRLAVEKVVKQQKEQIKANAIQSGRAAFVEHVLALNKRLGKPYMPVIPADFAGAIKGLKTLTSVKDAIATTLANAKIEANATADRIDANLKSLRELADGHKFLFADTAQIIHKANDDLVALIKSRIADHEAEQAKKLEAVRERIRAEEQAKAQSEAQQPAPHDPETSVPERAPAVAAPSSYAGGARLPADTGRRIKLGDINARIAPLTVSGDVLASFGFKPAGTDRTAKLYAESDFPRICQVLADHLIAAQYRREAA